MPYMGGSMATNLHQAELDARYLSARLHEQYAVWKLVGLFNPNGSTVPMKGGEDDHC
jgi:hypothetical protein